MSAHENQSPLDEQRLEVFLQSLETKNPEWLEALEEEALENRIPIVRKDTQSLVKVLLAMHKPTRILEIGTAVGFSALLMSEYAPATCQITTIENYEKRIPIAKENFRKAGRADRIQLLEGDAAVILPTLVEPFDWIFLDGPKAQYTFYLPELLRLLKPGGVLLADNVLQEGELLESRFAVTRRNRTIHARMRTFLLEIKQNPQLVTTILPQGDGVAICVKRGNIHG